MSSSESHTNSVGVIIYFTFALSAAWCLITFLLLQHHPVSGVQYHGDADIMLVETLPDVLGYTESYYSTTQSWLDLINQASKNIKIVAYYFTLTCVDNTFNSCPEDGDLIMNALLNADSRGVVTEILIDYPSFGYDDLELFAKKMKNLIVIKLDVKSLTNSSGIQHSKLLIADDVAFYMGSANLDWRALSEVKETGIYIKDKAVTHDILSIYQQLISLQSYDYDQLDVKVAAQFNFSNPACLKENKISFGVTPKMIKSDLQDRDIDVMIRLLDESTKEVILAAMDYAPLLIYGENETYWPRLDNAIRQAAFRGVSIKLVTQKVENGTEFWQHLMFLQGFSQFIKVYQFDMPLFEDESMGWDHSRLAHSKFLVADGADCLVSTSNFIGDYFENTIGIASIITGPFCQTLKNSFDRDIANQYVHDLI